MYQQSLYKVLDNHIKPKILKNNNKYKKNVWGNSFSSTHNITQLLINN
mgnify:CR=1 FL=1